MKRRYIILILLALTGCKRQESTRPQRRDIVDAVFASGNIETRDGYKVIANADGYLQTAYVSEGDTVVQGRTLFRLDGRTQITQVANADDNLKFAQTNRKPGSPQLEQLNFQIAQAVERFRLDSTNFRRYERLLPTQAVAKVDYDNALLAMQNSATSLQVLEKNKADLEHNLSLSVDNAKAQLRIQELGNDYFKVIAAQPGVVLTVAKRSGELVRKGDVLATVAAGKVYAKLFIAEDDIRQVQTGQEVLITLNTDKDRVYKAILTKIYPSFDDSDQAFIAEAQFTDATPADLKDGTQLQSNIVISEKKNVLVIPTVYLEPGDKVMLKEGHKDTAIRTGIRNLDYTEVLGGLGDQDVILLPKRQ
ncbi:MAG TPA: HlyD family efflux transporter periplasmic adaptor subunit [Dinghuibacter sp.]|uniref:efflux RND transporter periplasmic adaptor subunit n=1 Tax=Dinghuibacter sp. TaxID=2024697 RepID=UPI002C47CBC1|nr:HlyD family efflux transporter periplasmic adaptor subunit [Dinghuibacter sp.]HTJ11354.1 HlyD family efflux transporter periplasmic adaptor subunit [Dinghuibacter sp.]